MCCAPTDRKAELKAELEGKESDLARDPNHINRTSRPSIKTLIFAPSKVLMKYDMILFHQMKILRL